MTPEEKAEIRFAFTLETSENLAEMETALLALDASPQVGDELNALFRAVHTIKGSAGIVGADTVEQFCHDTEHLLSRIRELELALTPELVNLLLTCHDHIRSLVSLFEADDPSLPPAHDLLMAQIASWSARPSQTPPAAQDIPEERLPPAGDPAQESSADRKIVKVESAKLDQLINLVVELVTATSELESHVKRTADLAAVESAAAVSLLVKQVQERTMVFRMVPVGDLFRRFQRMLHDLSVDTGKQLRLQTAGVETELDKVLAEKIREPLLHLVRNAADHGIESREDRLAAGKEPCGVITLNAWQETGSVVLEVSDDGQGISRDRVVRKAIEKGVLKQGEAAAANPLMLIFEPGFSTVDKATKISGRGVGMDVVKRTVEGLRGKLEIESREGKGTSIRIRLPLSLALIDGFMVRVGPDLYIMPMELVDETLDMQPEDLQRLAQHGYHDLRGEALPCLDLHGILQISVPPPASRFAVVVKTGKKRTGLVVDSLEGAIKAVIKPLGGAYRNLRIISGATILGDGSIALILDVPELLKAA